MPRLIEQPTRITAAGNKPKLIEEFIGRVNSRHDEVSVARMKSPGGWVEPGQRPEFEEISVVLVGHACGSSTRAASWKCMPDRPSSADRANGSATARRSPRARSTSPSAGRRSHPRPCIEMRPVDRTRRQIPSQTAALRKSANAEPGSGTADCASEPLPDCSPKCDFQTS